MEIVSPLPQLHACFLFPNTTVAYIMTYYLHVTVKFAELDLLSKLLNTWQRYCPADKAPRLSMCKTLCWLEVVIPEVTGSIRFNGVTWYHLITGGGTPENEQVKSMLWLAFNCEDWGETLTLMGSETKIIISIEKKSEKILYFIIISYDN